MIPHQVYKLAVASLIVVSAHAYGQGNSANSNGAKAAPAADPAVEWSSLQNLLKPSPGNSAAATARGSIDQKSKISAQADQSRQAAASAKDFYTKYPTSPNAAEARKIEAIAEVRGIKEGDEVHERKALDAAKSFRQNSSNSVAARLEVALAADRYELSRKIKAKTVADRPAEKEKVADALRTEFGHTPELHAYYAEVARNGDMFTAKRIATNLLQWPADKKLKADAQRIVDRDAWVGKKLPLVLNTAETGNVDLSQPSGGITVLLTWAPAGGAEMLRTLIPYKTSIPPGVHFLYLALGGTGPEVASLQSAAPIKGRFSHLTGKAVGPVLTQLNPTVMPYLYVINRQGIVVGFGPVSELMNILAVASR